MIWKPYASDQSGFCIVQMGVILSNLNMESVGTIHAYMLMIQRMFCSCKLIRDVRSVFDSFQVVINCA